MSRAVVELDFLGLEKDKSSSASSSSISKSLDRLRSFRGIQSAISKINPELLKSVMASTAISAPKVEHNALPPLPVYVPVPRPTNVAETDSKEMAPFTIFYNGTVTVFDLSPDKAENILKLFAEASSKNIESENITAAAPSTDQQQQLLGDLPLFRRKSLQSFLAKRKERWTSLSPYACDNNNNYGRGSGRKTTTVGDKIGM